jgi:hypothetical protein
MPYRENIVSTEVGREFYGDTLQSVKYSNLTVDYKQLVDGFRGHWGYPDFPPNTNVGGGFYCKGFYQRKGCTASDTFWRGGPLNQSYQGCFSAEFIVGAEGYPSGTYTGDDWGAMAYARLKPTKPTFAGLNALYEMREVPAMLRQRFLDPTRPLASISNYWLALQFGWEPLLQDIRNMVQFQRNAQKKLKWLLANNGKTVRASTTLSQASSEPTGWTGFNYGALYPVLVTQYYASEPQYTFKRWETDHVWATGRFRYWLPDGPRDIAWTRMMMARLFGLQPSPRVIYNMIPWSWLIDWFSNAGDCLSMLDAGVADRLAADYWYVMREKAVEISYDVNGKFFRPNGEVVEVTASASNRSYSKYRTKGDPFGFNSNPNGLNPMQLSILGSLGLSRVNG